jgi:hypothetical protein
MPKIASGVLYPLSLKGREFTTPFIKGDTMYRFIEINKDKNTLLCSANLVGNNELAEIYTPERHTPRQALRNVLQKIKDPDIFVVISAFSSNEMVGRTLSLGEECILRILKRNLSGVRRRKFSKDEKEIVDMEKGEEWTEKKVNRAKTGSVRKRRTHNESTTT